MLIGFVGRIGSGKDTASDYLMKKYDFKSLRLSDVIAEDLNKQGLPNTRENKQERGAELRRLYGEDILMRKLFEKVKPGENYIFNGIRHPLEAQFLKNKGGILIKVECNDKVRFERIQKRDNIEWEDFVAIEKRESERLIDRIKVDFKIENNGTPEGLYRQIDRLMKEIT